MGTMLLGGLASVGLQAAPVSPLGAAGGLGGGAANVVGTLAGNPFQGSSGGSFSVAAPSGAPNASPVKPGGTNAVGQGRPPRVVQGPRPWPQSVVATTACAGTGEAIR
jgi:hypothetical protein